MDCPLLVCDRLMAAGDVDDRKAAHPETDAVIEVVPLIVGPPVRDRRGHPTDPIAIACAARPSMGDAADPAHQGLLIGDAGHQPPTDRADRRSTRQSTRSPREARW